MLDLVLSLVVLTAIALCFGAYALWRRTGNVKQPVLMLVLAVVAAINVAIWTLPDADGESPATRAEQIQKETDSATQGQEPR